MIRVCQIGPDAKSQGGMASVVAEYLNMSDEDVSITSIGTWWPDSRARSALGTLSALCRITTRNLGADIVHVHLSEGGSFLREGLLAIVASSMRLKTVATLHGADFTSFVAKRPRLVAAVLTRCDAVITLGPDHAKVIQEFLPKVNVATLLNPVTVPSQSIEKVGTVVAFSGEIGTRKGFDRLVAAWAEVSRECPEAVLHVCGPEGDLVCPTQLPSVRWFGAVTRDKSMQIMARARVTVLPSRREVLPMTILESLAGGTPVVTTRVGEWKSLPASGAVAFLDSGEEDDPRALASKILEKLSEDTSHSAATGREWVHANASKDAIALKLRRLYLGLGSKPAPTESSKK